MKNLIIVAAILAVFAVVSCKKANRVCECTDFTGTTSIKFTDKTTKGQAKIDCEGVTTKASDGTVTPAQESGTTCKLK